MTAFRVDVDFYHGPLDLLVVLVKQGEIDVLDLAIGELTRRYVESPELAPKTDLDGMGEFLVLVATLMESKSLRLLPNVESAHADEELDQTRQELVKQLLEYRRFREAASLLGEKAARQQQRFARQSRDLADAIHDPAKQPIRELELWDLVSAFSRLMKENVIPMAEEVERDPTPLPVYMNRLESVVKRVGDVGVSFRDLLGVNNSKARMIGKFLAVLELIKRGRVWVELDLDSDEIYFFPPREPVPPEITDSSMPMADANAPPDAIVHLNPSKTSDEDDDSLIPSWIKATEEQAPADPAKAWEDFEPLDDD